MELIVRELEEGHSNLVYNDDATAVRFIGHYQSDFILVNSLVDQYLELSNGDILKCYPRLRVFHTCMTSYSRLGRNRKQSEEYIWISTPIDGFRVHAFNPTNETYSQVCKKTILARNLMQLVMQQDVGFHGSFSSGSLSAKMDDHYGGSGDWPTDVCRRSIDSVNRYLVEVGFIEYDANKDPDRIFRHGLGFKLTPEHQEQILERVNASWQ